MTNEALSALPVFDLRADVIPKLASSGSVALYFVAPDLQEAFFRRLLQIVPESLVFSWTETMSGEVLPELGFRVNLDGPGPTTRLLVLTLDAEPDEERMRGVLRGTLSQGDIASFLNKDQGQSWRDCFWETFMEERVDLLETRQRDLESQLKKYYEKLRWLSGSVGRSIG